MLAERVLTIQNLSKTYTQQGAGGAKPGGDRAESFGLPAVVDHFNLEINLGERLALFAPSGTGKTTLFHILNGLIEADQGEFAFANGIHPVTIFQDPRLFAHLTVEENILLPLRVKRITPDRTYLQSLEEWLERCGLQTARRKYPWQLSGGMKQKTAFLRGILDKPNFLLMDEPLRSVDIRAKSAIYQALIPYLQGSTIFFTTHLAEDISLLASDVLLMEGENLSQPRRFSVEAFQNLYLKTQAMAGNASTNQYGSTSLADMEVSTQYKEPI